MSAIGRFNAVSIHMWKTEEKTFIRKQWKIEDGVTSYEEILLLSHPTAQIHFSVNKQLLVPVLSITYMQN